MKSLKFDILTLFPELFGDFLKTGLIGQACQAGYLDVVLHSLRPFSSTSRGMIDDAPYGGGEGMVMKAEPLAEALKPFRQEPKGPGSRPIIYLTPQGTPLTAARARAFSDTQGAILLCGRYSGIDERIRQLFVDEELSIGDYVLMGGEVPAMVVLEAAARFIPGVLGSLESAESDSFESGLLEGPLYTRPQEFDQITVPKVLLSGNHHAISQWRHQMALERTRTKRPDLVGPKQGFEIQKKKVT